MNIREMFVKMVNLKASDIYLRIKAYPRARINGTIEVIGDSLITSEEMMSLTHVLLGNDERRKMFQEKWSVDFIHFEPDIGRFRVNVFMQRNTPSIVARHVFAAVDTFFDLHLPEIVCKKFADLTQGLCLVCGPAGNGKSTTVASIIEHINRNKSKHIITLEDPIEFLFEDKKAFINQREIGKDVATYPDALRSVTLQSPDIIYIGNIRDYSTMKAAITATELGAGVFTTFHTVNAVQTIIRIINFFPPHLHDEVRMQLSLILKGSISLRLIPRKDGKGRIPACETLVITPTIARLIHENKIKEIQNFIDEGAMFGMCSFQQSLVALVKEGLVDVDVARTYADSADDFDLEIRGIKRVR
ncbi:MAG: PilT/PilU family type 4a pilus ATPase [Candidatus Omnitrophica bacterium]|nr:PilT/PilU family type 4a pilus ATPase [Candidatus Omnitrophota bacterium]